MKTVFMVEGTKDADQIHKAFEGNTDVKTLITEGTKVNNRIKAEIENYQRQGYGIYILSDPDEAGKQLAQMIQYWYPEIPRVEVETKECAYFTGKKLKAGIEYASYRYLRKLLSPIVGIEYVDEEPTICWD